MSDFKDSLIKLGHTYPELRPHLRVILAHKAFPIMFGELRSLFSGTRDARAYKEILATVTALDAIDSARTRSEVIPYVESQLRRFPDKVRTYSELTLMSLNKPASRLKLYFAKVYVSPGIRIDALKDPVIARKVLLETKATGKIRSYMFSDLPLSNDEVIEAANSFAPMVGDLDLTNRDMPADTLKRLKVPLAYLYIEGNPRISQEDIQAYKDANPHVVVIHDILNEGGMTNEDLYDFFAEDLTGLFEAPTRISRDADGAPTAHSSFGEDIPEGRDGRYTIRMLPVEEGDTKIRFVVTVDGYDHSSVEEFDIPREDKRSQYGGNRHVFRIVLKLNELLNDIKRGKR